MVLAQLTSTYRAKLIAETYKNWFKPHDKVLDIGCGTGVVSMFLANKFSLALTGCDIDRYLIKKIPFKKMHSATRLPSKSGWYNVAMFNDVLHHTMYQNQSRLIKDSLRVSRVVLIFELKPTLLGKLLDFILNKIHNLRMDVPFTYRSEPEWIKLFKDMKVKYAVKKVRAPFWYPFTHVAFKISR